jgi:hypothetical protein
VAIVHRGPLELVALRNLLPAKLSASACSYAARTQPKAA